MLSKLKFKIRTITQFVSKMSGATSLDVESALRLEEAVKALEAEEMLPECSNTAYMMGWMKGLTHGRNEILEKWESDVPNLLP